MFNNIKTAEQIEAERIEKAADSARSKRDGLLKETDYIVMPDYPMADKTPWETYRQELRDVTKQAGFSDAIVWPTKPV